MGTSGLVALSSAAILAVYAAGYYKTKAAADRFASESSARRPPGPAQFTEPAVGAVEAVRAGTVRPPQRAPERAPASAPVRARAGASAATPTLPTLQRSAEPAAAQPVPAAVAAANPAADSASKAAAPIPTDSTPPVPTAKAAEPSPAPAAQTAQQQPAAQKPPAPVWKDGTYFGWGTSRHGDIQAAVTIQDGRITEARISQCLTRYSCSWISALPPQVVTRQSPEVDYVSGATQSTNAFYYAVVEALARAK